MRRLDGGTVIPCHDTRKCGGKEEAAEMPRARGSRHRLAGLSAVTQLFSSTDQYALSRKVFHDWYLLWVSLRLSSGLRLGFSGFLMRCMCASLGVRPPFLT